MLPATGDAKAGIVTVRCKKWWRRAVKRALAASAQKSRKPRKNLQQSDASIPGSRLESRVPWPTHPDGWGKASEHKPD